MALDKVLIGDRIRKIREEVFEESRAKFAQRCNLTENHIGEIERGEIFLSLKALDKIISATGVDAHYILYGKKENKKTTNMIENLYNIINLSDQEEIKMYYKCICTIKSYVTKNKKD